MSNLQTACKYFGCPIEVNGNIHTMWGIVPDGVWYTDGRTNRVAKWGEWKPILKPLSEITDEDAVEVARMFGIVKPTVRAGKCIVSDYSLMPDITDFLRSKFYDIDNLIAKGEAVVCQTK
jgi:hypothetical protein